MVGVSDREEPTPIPTARSGGAIASRLREQLERIRQAEDAAGRPPFSVRLVAVSKRHGVDAILEAYAAGQRDFGENYVQELVDKAEQLKQYTDIRWHLIGHLQSNKARFVAGLAHCVHTLSSEKLVRELGRRLRQRVQIADASAAALTAQPADSTDAPLPSDSARLGVLVEVNVSGEMSKSGCKPEELGAILQAIDEEPQLQALGLMTMPPYDPDPELARPIFERLRNLREQHGGVTRLPELSMGMSHDAEQAIFEGATMVRIGTAIFGERSSAHF